MIFMFFTEYANCMAEISVDFSVHSVNEQEQTMNLIANVENMEDFYIYD